MPVNPIHQAGGELSPSRACVAQPLVIAWGNSLRGDDGVGLAVADEFARNYPGAAVVIRCQQLTPELAEDIAGATAVAFVDAAAGSPGAIQWRDATAICRSVAQPTLGHTASVETLLAYAREVYGGAPVAALLTIGGKTFGFGKGLSPAVSAAIPVAVRELHDWFEGRTARSRSTGEATAR